MYKLERFKFSTFYLILFYILSIFVLFFKNYFIISESWYGRLNIRYWYIYVFENISPFTRWKKITRSLRK